MDMEKNQRVAMVFGCGGLGDHAYYNRMGFKGLNKAIQQLGIAFDYRLPNTDSDIEPQLREFAEERVYSLVMVMGFGASAALQRVAAAFPSQLFAAFDARADLPNVSNYGGDPRSVAFLAGGVAASLFKTGKVGALFGTENSGYWRWVAGYIAGAKFSIPHIDVVPKFLSSWSPSPEEGEAAADELYHLGVDVIMAHLDEGDVGVFRAARKNVRYAIGFNGERELDPQYVLFDLRRYLDALVYDAVERIVNENFQAGFEAWGMERGQFGLELGEPVHPRITKDVIHYMEKLKALLASGRLGNIPGSPDEIEPFLEDSAGLQRLG
jgi:basic membrane protein A